MPIPNSSQCWNDALGGSRSDAMACLHSRRWPDRCSCPKRSTEADYGKCNCRRRKRRDILDGLPVLLQGWACLLRMDVKFLLGWQSAVSQFIAENLDTENQPLFTIGKLPLPYRSVTDPFWPCRIDGEAFPFESFHVEVHTRVANLLSLNGDFFTSDFLKKPTGKS